MTTYKCEDCSNGIVGWSGERSNTWHCDCCAAWWIDEPKYLPIEEE
jgi:hypothetical protein